MTLINSTCHKEFEFGEKASRGWEFSKRHEERKEIYEKTEFSGRGCQGAPVAGKNLPATRVAHTNRANRENRLILQPLIIPATVPSEAMNHFSSLSAQEPEAEQRSRATTNLILNHHHPHSAQYRPNCFKTSLLKYKNKNLLFVQCTKLI